MDRNLEYPLNTPGAFGLGRGRALRALSTFQEVPNRRLHQGLLLSVDVGPLPGFEPVLTGEGVRLRPIQAPIQGPNTPAENSMVIEHTESSVSPTRSFIEHPENNISPTRSSTPSDLPDLVSGGDSSDDMWSDGIVIREPGVQQYNPLQRIGLWDQLGTHTRSEQMPVVQNQEYTFPDCPVCLVPLLELLQQGHRLKFLRCGHLVCQACLKGIIESQPRHSSQISCPKCRAELFEHNFLWIFDLYV